MTLVCFGIILSTILLELILRILGFGYKLYYRLPEPESPSSYNILCIGESTTWGVGTKNPLQENYPKQLEDLLNARFPEKKIRCFFDQSIGQNTSEILLKFPRYIKKYKPQLVILMVGVNNWWNLDRSNILLFNDNKLISRTTLKILIFLDRFRLWKLMKWIRLSLGLYKERWNYFPNKEMKEEPSFRFYSWENQSEIFSRLAEHDIEEMVKICLTNNIKVIIASYPMEGDEIYLIHKRIAQKYHLLFLDNYLLFKNLNQLKDYLSSDNWHPNEKGYALVAENIYQLILRHNLIP